MAKRKAAVTYRDGVGLERCVTCHAGVRGLDGAPVVSLRVDDVEVLYHLADTARPRVPREFLERVRQALGRTEARHG